MQNVITFSLGKLRWSRGVGAGHLSQSKRTRTIHQGIVLALLSPQKNTFGAQSLGGAPP